MSEHRYILEPYKGTNTRYTCPSCKQAKTFSRYIDNETGEQIHPSVGRCNRVNNCKYHYTPKQYFQDNNISFDTPQPQQYNKPKTITTKTKPVSFISVDMFKASLKGYKANHFVKFIIDLFGVEVASKLISKYFIATSKHWNGSTIFWQIDIHGNIRTGKIMLYNSTTGKRVKEPYKHINWVHSLLKQPEFELKQCLFGEHLLQSNTKPVAIVESEKTAIIASIYLPQFTWLAFGGLDNFNAEKCNILKGRTVVLFPDLKAFEKWNSKAKELSHIAKFIVSNLLECKATEAEKQQGFDLADYLIKFDYKEFALPETMPVEQNPVVKPLVEVVKSNKVEFVAKPEQTEKRLFGNQKSEPENWEQLINELEQYFKTIELPFQPVKLNTFSTITDISLFINSHLDIIKANNGKPSFLPYLNRLQELKQFLTININ